MCEEHNIPKVYDPASVEKKWYEFWEKHRYFHAEVEEGKEANFILFDENAKSKAPQNSLYAKDELLGEVKAHFIKGERVFG